MNLRTILPLIAVSALALASEAQMMNTVPADLAMLTELREQSRSSANAEGNTYQLVDAFMRPSKGRDGSLLRTSWHANGRIHVRVVDATGSLRMTGTYLDEALQVGHGTFEFYHAGGQLESTGAFSEGRKAGLWRRYDKNGQELAHRIYGATEPEAVLVNAGLASKAAMLTSH
ncbi:MAG: hypothetical protein IPK99_01200 [Flavobacteriales bacterium]|nr:hypothetical protein [Flavobacteriales bacterium]